MGKAEEALSCFQKALIVNPLHKDASEVLKEDTILDIDDDRDKTN
jgi:hypothetical protein